jgi:thiol-disulfide isomerase/thioredoxin
MRRLRAWKYWPWLRDLVLIALVVIGIRVYQQRSLPSGAAPELAGRDLSGAAAALSDYRGKPVLLHFWATWCGVCKAEQSSLDAVSRDLPVLTVASQSGSAAEVGAFVREHGVEPRVIVDASSALARRFGVTMYPTTFVIDAAGEIRHVEVGYTTELGMRARMWFAAL